MAIAIRRLLLPLLACVVGLAALGFSARLYVQSRQVEQHGLLAPVTAIGDGKKVKRSGNRVSFRADVTFTAGDGRRITSAAILSGEALDGFRSGQPLQLRYLPDQPEVVRIVGEEDEGGSWLLVLVGVAALAYGGFGFVSGRGRTKQPRARRKP